VSIVTAHSGPRGLVCLRRIMYGMSRYHPVQTWGFVTRELERASVVVVMKEGHVKEVISLSNNILCLLASHSCLSNLVLAIHKSKAVCHHHYHFKR
jgi:hypothetical protein